MGRQNALDRELVLYALVLFVMFAAIRLAVPKLIEMSPAWVTTAVTLIFLSAFTIVLVGILLLYFWGRFDESDRSAGPRLALVLCSLVPLAFLTTMFALICDYALGTNLEGMLPSLSKATQSVIGVAAGAVVLLLALLYFWISASAEDQSWSEYFMNMNVFVIWVGFGCVLIVASGFVDGLAVRLFGPGFKDSLLNAGEQGTTRIVGAGAVLLATALTIWSTLVRR